MGAVCRVDACRLKMQAQVGRKEEASDGIQMKQTELKDIQSSLDFFEEQFNAVQRGTREPARILISKGALVIYQGDLPLRVRGACR